MVDASRVKSGVVVDGDRCVLLLVQALRAWSSLLLLSRSFAVSDTAVFRARERTSRLR